MAPPAALSAPGVNGGSKAEPIEPRSFEGLDEPVVRSIQALCQVSNAPIVVQQEAFDHPAAAPNDNKH